MRSIRSAYLILATAVAGCAFLAFRHQLSPGMAGEVYCRGNTAVSEPPIANFPNADPELRMLARDENLLHESMHKEQFRLNCRGTALRWAKDALFRLDLETQAYCYGMQVYRDTAYLTRRRGDELKMLSVLYGSDVGFEDIYQALSRWCVAPGGPKP